jgi:hypothetical protein
VLRPESGWMIGIEIGCVKRVEKKRRGDGEKRRPGEKEMVVKRSAY